LWESSAGAGPAAPGNPCPPVRQDRRISGAARMARIVQPLAATVIYTQEISMSLLGAMNTSISGLTSQAAAFGNISDDIANSQTVGFKRVDTNFIDYLTTSTATDNESGAVVAQPDYVNTVQGSVTQTDNPLGLAISGQGFFAVSQSTSAPGAAPAFSPQQYYTRAGDFQMNASGYLVNGDGEYLNGWIADPTTGQLDKTNIAPIQVSQTAYKPVATGNVTLSANLPPGGNPDAVTGSQDPVTSNISVYDAQGTAHQLTLSFTSSGSASNNWTLNVSDDAGNTIGTATLAFGADGTLSSIAQGGGTQSTAGQTGTLTLNTLYPTASGGTQNIALNIGKIGGTDGLTQFASSGYTLSGISQDGVPPGSFSSVTMTDSGNVVVNYNNGQSRTVAQVPVVTFNAADALQRQNGASFTATLASGAALAEQASTNGAGTLVTNSVEQSNVDIASEFSQLIVAQQAYSANAKAVTTASDMMQATLDMKR
jgi:flagellar hook protein FlgE